MRWVKNWFSYVTWILYVLMVGVGLFGLTGVLCASSGIAIYPGIAICVVCIGLVGLGVFLIQRYAPKYSVSGEKNDTARTVVEAVVTVLFLAIGLVLRLQDVGEAGEKAAYFETASVTAGQSIPPLVHGAVYFYLQLLHILYYFLGNRFVLGIWLQVLVQFGAILTLFFAVRHFAGHIAAVLMLGFCMFSPYMVQEALVLSPEMLYLLLWSVTLFWIVAGYKGKLKVGGFLPLGIMIAVMSYLDIAGVLLFLLTVAVIFGARIEKPAIGTKIKALLLCISGIAVGFTACVSIDAYLCKRGLEKVLNAWFLLYHPETFRIPLSLEVPGISADYIILFLLLTVGIFSFWCEKRWDYQRIWVLGTVILVVAGCLGIFTQEMPVNMYLYLILVLMAGIGVENCFRPIEQIISRGILEQPPKSQLEKAPEQPPKSRLETVTEQQSEKVEEQPKKIQMIENPLPLPKKHKKRVLDYDIVTAVQKDDFDISVDEEDDFDI